MLLIGYTGSAEKNKEIESTIELGVAYRSSSNNEMILSPKMRYAPGQYSEYCGPRELQ
jgi:hypothetical protein